MRQVTRFLMAVAVVCAAMAPAPATAQTTPPYGAFYAFGDSLADTGNAYTVTKLLGLVPAVPPSESPNKTYFEGRFSNGPVAFEYLWGGLQGQPGTPLPIAPVLASSRLPRTGAVNLAFGGAATGLYNRTPGGFLVPGLRGQVELFRAGLAGKKAPAGALFAIVAGANDYMPAPPAVPAAPPVVVGNITTAIRALHRLGARDFLVLGLPDLGTAPIVANTPQSAGLSALSQAHNALLAQAVGALTVELSGSTVRFVDLNAVLPLLPPDTNLQVPALDFLFGAPAPGLPPMSVCIFVDARLCQDVPTFSVPPQFFYWDALHPTTATHGALGQYLLSVVAGQPVLTQ